MSKRKGKHKAEMNFVIETNLTAKEHALIAEGMKEYEKNPESFITLAEYKKAEALKPLLSVLAEPLYSVETDLTAEEISMIEEGVAEYRADPSSFKPWASVRRG